MKAGALLIGLAACSSAVKPVEPSAPAPGPAFDPPPATVVSAVCPYGLLDGFAWAREVFPGCSPPPFLDQFVTCESGCPQPCSATYERNGEFAAWLTRGEYDAQGRMTVWEAGDTQIMTATYAGDELTAWAQPGSQGYTFRYDLQGRLVETYGGETGLDASYMYDTKDNAIYIKDHALGSVRLTYDDAWRLAKTDAGGLITEYAYDARGRVTGSRRDGKPDLAYSYDAHELLVKVTSAWGGDTFELTYDQHRRPLVITKSSVDSVGAPMRDEWEYHYVCPPAARAPAP